MAAAVVVLVVVSHVIVESAGWRFLQPAADESLRVVEAFRQRGEPVDVALLGSSRIRRAVVVSVLEEELTAAGRGATAFNFGLQAGGVPAFYILARDLLEGELAPRLFVLGLGARAMNANNPRHVRTIRHMASPADLLGPIGPRRASELGAGVLALFRAPATLLQSWRLWSEPEEEIGALLGRDGSIYESAAPVRIDPVQLAERTERRARRTRESLLQEYDPHGRSAWALERLFALAQERGIPMVVINLPVSEEFSAAAYDGDQYQRYLSVVQAACEAAGVPWIDANSDELRPAWPMFMDGDHLNAAGATAFSRWLARELAPRLQ